jgi:hypothetical protein
MAGVHVQIYLWTFDPGWPQQYIIQKCMSGIYDVNVEGNSLVMCSWVLSKHITCIHEEAIPPAGISWAFPCDHSQCWLVACFATLAMSLSDSPSACASPKMWERTLHTHSSKSGSVGVGVPAVEVSCMDIVIEDGVVASLSVVLNCTVLLSVAFWGTRVWLYLGLSRNDVVQVDSWERWLPFTCMAQRMSTQTSSDSWDQAFWDSGDNWPNVS